MTNLDNLRDPLWRLNNLYWVKQKSGPPTKFRLWTVQEYLYRNMHNRNINLKARQMGFSTFWQLFYLDKALFNSGATVGIIAHKLTAATEIFTDKIKFAYDHLPDDVKELRGAESDNKKEMRFSNDSKISVDTSLRSGTVNYLHISEYGKICAQHPERAREIRTGALNTVYADDINIVAIESTAEGKSGHFWELCRDNWDRPADEELTPLDYKFLFFPWWQAPEYRLKQKVVIPDEMEEYFSMLRDVHDIRLSHHQKYWYVKKAKEQGEDIKREMPSYKEEAFEQAVLGAYFSKQMAYVEKEGMIGKVPWQPGYPVDTFWDIGHRDFAAIWFYQNINGRNHFIDYYYNSEEEAPHYARILQEKQRERGYVYGNHHLPHDAANKTFIGNTLDILQRLGVRPVRVGQRVDDKSHAIEAARAKIPTCFFDEARCADGLNALRNYRKRWNEKMQEYSDKPEHNWASHGADAFMEFAVNYRGPVSHAPLNYQNNRIYA